jgi:glutathione S-transferase
MLELYHHGSSACAAKVRFALAEKGLAWDGHYIDLMAGEQFDPGYLAINPKAVVPTLVHDGRIVVESTVICEYVDEVFAEQPIYPSDSYARAAVRIWTKAVDEELHPCCSALTYVVSHRHTIDRSKLGDFEGFVQKGGSDGSTARRRKWNWIQQGLDAEDVPDFVRLYDGYLHKMERALQAQAESAAWLSGGDFSMADVALAPYLYRLESLAMTGFWVDGRLPAVSDWWLRIKARPAFIESIANWMPAELREAMRSNGENAWPRVKAMRINKSF